MKPQHKDNPSSIFYWKDYENDESLRISSLAAQGLWMRLLCIAAKADPYGYILVNGFPLEATGAARLAGVTEGEAQSLLQELERNGVFSRDRKGRMFSRRMVRDAAVRAKAQKNGAKGGNPALSASPSKERETRGSVNPPDNPPLKPPYPFPSSQSLEEQQQLGGNVPDQTDRERLLVAIGANPVSGQIGPNGRRLGTLADTEEAAKWTAMGLTLDQQCAAISERCAAMRKKNPHWTPGSFAYFTGAMADLAAARSAPLPTGNAKTASDRDAKLAKYERIAKQGQA